MFGFESEANKCLCLPLILPASELFFGIQHRARQRIRSTILKDCCQVMWCPWCYVCRLSRDMKYTELCNGTLD
ncbi:hypothetical protein EG68_01336 [Paragonimus skrjabini miyazakii]|uniref:Cornifelin n=1 Tax=Paragonimus skrjabini miyazakii TaxID=59628 RepID=A0A8S9Z1K2_9TREM|nr:hypothetical protein EG68_01336 [Paragonimus skrjabini miyazakii]